MRVPCGLTREDPNSIVPRMIAFALLIAVQEPPPATPEVPVVPYAYTDPPPALPAPDRPAPDREHGRRVPPQGMDGVTVGALQMGAGTAACCVGCCVSVPAVYGLGLIPVVGGVLGALANDIITGAFIGATEGFVGDSFGQQRSALLWPVATSAGILVAVNVVTIAIGMIASVNGVTPPTNPADPAAATTYLAQAGPYALANGVISLAGTAAAIVVPVLVYGVTAVDKKPGDTGQGLPGLTSPADPVPAKAPTTVAMRY